MKPEDAKKTSKFDQSCALLADRYPAMWRRLYENCKEEGFSEDQALQLLVAYIMSSAMNGVHYHGPGS